MRILVLHTHYRQPGGEDRSVAAEVALLREKGHPVREVWFHNRDMEALPRWKQAGYTVWNPEAYRRVRREVERFRPDVVHVHNTFPLASPAVVRAASDAGVPVVMSLRNYRMMCVNAMFFRKGQVCEACMGGLPWRGVVYGCYRNSRLASGVVAGMLAVHRWIGTWERVSRFIALTQFARSKFIEAGFPPSRVVVKPNFVYPDPGPGKGQGGYALFVGRLAPEKGVDTLLQAWKRISHPIPLRVVGEGPLRDRVREAARRDSRIHWMGPREHREVLDLMGDAAFLIFPSRLYETFGRVAVEAFARGTPVVASRIGAVAEITVHGRTGRLFRPGDPEDLAAQVTWMMEHPAEVRNMRQEARAEYERKYTAERNYAMLMDIYHEARTAFAT